jgi:hypothetical protein
LYVGGAWNRQNPNGFAHKQSYKRPNCTRWNTRVDRSLREGREILHQQVRAREPMYVWLEGADDADTEAQAFGPALLETA